MKEVNMYSYDDTKKIFMLSRNGELVNSIEFPELSNIKDKIQSILSYTNYYTFALNDEVSYQSINYMINLLNSIPKEQLDLIDFHLMDSIIFSANRYDNEVFNKLKAIVKPSELDNDITYLYNITKVINKLWGTCTVTGFITSTYRKLNRILKEIYKIFIVNGEYLTILDLVGAYIYRNVEKYSDEMISKVFNTIFNDEEFLLKISLNSKLALYLSVEVLYIDEHSDNNEIMTLYNMVINAVDSIVNNNEMPKDKIIIR